MTVTEALAEARATLAEIEGGARDARWLLAAAMGVPRDRLTLMAREAVAPDQAQSFRAMLARRAAREPVSHIIGTRSFWGREFQVGPDVLDPRPETEVLVAAAVARPFARVLDLGTGSGALLITLLAERLGATGLGTDVSAPALAVAHQNAAQLGVAARAAFQAGDWLDGVTGTFDLIVSNPPYIPAAEMPALAPELAHEPRGALTDEADGLSAYRAIFAAATGVLAPGGRILVEHGAGQSAHVAAIAQGAGWHDTRVHKDFDGRPRVLEAQFGLKRQFSTKS